MADKKVKLKYKGISGPNNEKHNEVREYSTEQAEYLLAAFPGQFKQVKDSEKKSEDSSKKSSDGSAADKRSDKKAKTQNKK